MVLANELYREPTEKSHKECEIYISANHLTYPDVDELEDWLGEGGCESLDGCWVEPDGHCEHGYPSWLLFLALI